MKRKINIILTYISITINSIITGIRILILVQGARRRMDVLVVNNDQRNKIGNLFKIRCDEFLDKEVDDFNKKLPSDLFDKETINTILDGVINEVLYM